MNTPASPARRRHVRGEVVKVHAVLLFIQFTFGGFHVFGKYVLTVLSPMSLAGLRVCAATPILLLLAWITDRRLPSLRQLPYLAMLGFFGVFANQLLFIHGLQRTTAINASILMPSIPVFTAVIGSLAGIERLKPLQFAGVALAVSGAVVLLNPLGASFNRATALGNAMLLINCVSYAVFLVLQRPVLRSLPPLTVIAWAFLFGGAGVLAVSFDDISAIAWNTVTPDIYAGIVYIVLIPTALNYALNTWAIGRSSPSLSAIYTTMQPVAGTVLAVLLLGESFGMRQLAGFAGIALGVFLVARNISRAPSAA